MASDFKRTARAAGARAQQLADRLQHLRPRAARRSAPRPWLMVLPAIGALVTAATTALLWDERRRNAARQRAASAAGRIRRLPERAATMARNGREQASVELADAPVPGPHEPANKRTKSTVPDA